MGSDPPGTTSDKGTSNAAEQTRGQGLTLRGLTHQAPKLNQGTISVAEQTTTHYPDDEIDLRELFATLWRGKWIIIAFTIVGERNNVSVVIEGKAKTVFVVYLLTCVSC